MRLAYLWSQFWHTWGKKHKDPTFRIEPAITVLRDMGHLPHGAKVLDLGCRNRVEPRLLRGAGWKVTPVDLFPMSRGIRRADMHNLPFEKNAFDAVVASHVLEHAYNAEQVFAEIIRVVKRGGLLWAAWPRGFTPNGHDRFDYGSPGKFAARILKTNRESIVLWSEDLLTEGRILMRIR